MGVFICQGCGQEQATWGGSCPSCGNTETIRLQSSTDQLLDKVIKGRYKILKKLGQGGMGAVYLAEQVGIGQKVALKFLKAEFSSDVELTKRFLNEAKSYGRISHPNAVTVHDFGQAEGGDLFIAMEYCEGADLKREIAEQKRLPLGYAADIALQVADVLGHAHSRGVVHRDLKPENIMLLKGMRRVHVKILDFGIARLMEEGTRLTIAGSIAGTPRYMSPEQVEGKDVDHRADIYSLGVVFYECLTGVQPFDGASIGEILRKQVMQPMPHLLEHAPDLELPEVDDIIQKACAKAREDRFPDMAAFAAALAPLMPTQQVTIPAGIMASMGTLPDGRPAAVRGEATGLQQGSDLGTVQGGASLLGKSLDGRQTIDEVPVSAPKSKVPLIAGGLIALGAVAAVVAMVLGGGGESPAKPRDPVVVTKDPVKPPDGPPGRPDEPMVPVRVAVNELELAKAKQNLTQGSTEFANGNLEASRTYFASVPAGLEQSAEAEAMVKKIDEIDAATRKGLALKAKGLCDEALVHLEAALRLNPKAKDAATARAGCKQALLPGQME